LITSVLKSHISCWHALSGGFVFTFATHGLVDIVALKFNEADIEFAAGAFLDLEGWGTAVGLNLEVAGLTDGKVADDEGFNTFLSEFDV